MKTCPLCGQNVPATVIIDGKRRNLVHRKYCLTCSPFGEHNTSPLEKPKSDDVTIIQATCENCGNLFSYKRNTVYLSKRKRIVCNTCKVNKRRPIRKQEALNIKGGRCIICGYDKCVSALTFHHIDPSDKDRTVASLYLSNIKMFLEELNKCVLLCCRCHSEHHAGMISTEELVALETSRCTKLKK